MNRRAGLFSCFLAWSVLTVLSGCAPSTSLLTPQIAVPQNFEVSGNEKSASLDRWWDNFDDPQLSSLIQTALADSTDARIAYFRIREARALRDQAVAETWPSGGLSGSAAFQHTKQLSGVSLTGAGNAESYSLAFNPSWEIDLFGRLDASRDAAEFNYTAFAFDYHATRLTLAADVASALFQTRGIAVQLDDARDIERIANELAQTSRLGYEHGLVAGADTAQLDSELSNARAEVARLQAALRTAKRSLLVLIGRPNSPTDDLVIEARLDTPPPIPLATPGILLARRPDVLSAEFRLAAATRSVEIDRLNLFPRFTLQPGVSLSKSTGLFSGASALWSIGVGLELPILDRSRLIAQLRVTEARGQQAVVDYERAVQTAFKEAENALTNASADHVRLAELSHATERARFAFEAARIGYDKGLTDLTSLIQTERAWLATRANYTSARAAALNNAVTVFRTLGGGWTPGDAATIPGQSPVFLSETR